MRPCPVCQNSKLNAIPYEGIMVLVCKSCLGTLVDAARIESIRRNLNTDLSVLMKEVENFSSGDTLFEIDCPKCNLKMDKHIEKISKTSNAGPNKFILDVCSGCDLVWLDGGELAKIQLQFEFSRKGKEARRHFVKFSDMSQAQKEAYVEGLSEAMQPRVPLDLEDIIDGLLDGSNHFINRHNL